MKGPIALIGTPLDVSGYIARKIEHKVEISLLRVSWGVGTGDYELAPMISSWIFGSLMKWSPIIIHQ